MQQTHTEIVLGGMELLRWQYSWRQWQQNETGVLARFQAGGLLDGVAITLAGASLIGTLAHPAFGFVAAGAAGVWIVRWVRSGARRLLGGNTDPPQVLFTSTGVMIGDEPHPFRARGSRLRSVDWDGRLLRLWFRKTARRKPVDLIIPTELRPDMTELVELLRAKTSSLPAPTKIR